MEEIVNIRKGEAMDGGGANNGRAILVASSGYFISRGRFRRWWQCWSLNPLEIGVVVVAITIEKRREKRKGTHATALRTVPHCNPQRQRHMYQHPGLPPHLCSPSHRAVTPNYEPTSFNLHCSWRSEKRRKVE